MVGNDWVVNEKMDHPPGIIGYLGPIPSPASNLLVASHLHLFHPTKSLSLAAFGGRLKTDPRLILLRPNGPDDQLLALNAAPQR